MPCRAAVRRIHRGLVPVVALGLLVAACGSGSGTGKAKEAVKGTGACTHPPRFDPANFVDPTLSTNRYHPLKPGMQWVRGGTSEVGSRTVPHEVISTMTDVIREIDGVPTVAMLDESTDSGEVSQVGLDYFALDRDGNVWILGGYTEDYEGGEYTNTEDHWLGTADGTQIGILSPAEVTRSTPTWCVGSAPGDAPTVGTPKRIGIRECVKFGCYDDVLVVEEGAFNAPDNEDKYYVPGVGVIRNQPLDASLHQDTFELLNLIELTPEGLAEASQTVLDLETHARETAPKVYGSSPESQRAPSEPRPAHARRLQVLRPGRRPDAGAPRRGAHPDARREGQPDRAIRVWEIDAAGSGGRSAPPR